MSGGGGEFFFGDPLSGGGGEVFFGGNLSGGEFFFGDDFSGGGDEFFLGDNLGRGGGGVWQDREGACFGGGLGEDVVVRRSVVRGEIGGGGEGEVLGSILGF